MNRLLLQTTLTQTQIKLRHLFRRSCSSIIRCIIELSSTLWEKTQVRRKAWEKARESPKAPKKKHRVA